MKVLIPGISGGIARRVALKLLLAGHEVVGIDARPWGDAPPENERHAVDVRKRAGRVQQLAELVQEQPIHGTIGIGHTRWATHGGTTDTNSHPHIGGNGEVVLVHNGVIENYTLLRTQLQGLGYVFRTETDTEAIAHLIAHHLDEQIKSVGEHTATASLHHAVSFPIRVEVVPA